MDATKTENKTKNIMKYMAAATILQNKTTQIEGIQR